jgi:hypothetical protein
VTAIDLTGLPEHDSQMIPVEFGGVVQSPLGGAAMNLRRLGDRWSMQVTTAALPMEPDGRRWAARLTRARRCGAVMPIELEGFAPGLVGAPVIAADTRSGRVLTLSGLRANYVVREGQWLSIIHGGRRVHTDQVLAQVVADGSGNATIEMQNLLRTGLHPGDVVELARPMIQGLFKDTVPIPRPLEGFPSFTFTIVEDV